MVKDGVPSRIAVQESPLLTMEAAGDAHSYESRWVVEVGSGLEPTSSW